jgi:hypothetical protein
MLSCSHSKSFGSVRIGVQGLQGFIGLKVTGCLFNLIKHNVTRESLAVALRNEDLTTGERWRFRNFNKRKNFSYNPLISCSKF